MLSNFRICCLPSRIMSHITVSHVFNVMDVSSPTHQTVTTTLFYISSTIPWKRFGCGWSIFHLYRTLSELCRYWIFAGFRELFRWQALLVGGMLHCTLLFDCMPLFHDVTAVMAFLAMSCFLFRGPVSRVWFSWSPVALWTFLHYIIRFVFSVERRVGRNKGSPVLLRLVRQYLSTPSSISDAILFRRNSSINNVTTHTRYRYGRQTGLRSSS